LRDATELDGNLPLHFCHAAAKRDTYANADPNSNSDLNAIANSNSYAYAYTWSRIDC